ncbi:MAG: SPOR domain-containing protein [Bryobacteraceae bacterium]
MLRTSESETEILLGNKQLAGIFFVMAVLLGIAFTGGYMVGRGSTPKKAAAETPAANGSAVSANPTGGETHSVPGDSTDTAAAQEPAATKQAAKANPADQNPEPPLGSPDRKKFQQTHPAPPEPAPATNVAEGFVPQPGQEFLQVGAVAHDEAEATARVLRKEGFHAHAVIRPGNPKLYRVLIGPIQDAADLSSTRDSLRKTGFREVIVQKY